MKIKRIALFICFKVAEIGLLIFMPYYLGKLIPYISPAELLSIPFVVQFVMRWMTGILILIAFMGFLFVLYLILEAVWRLCRANWEWAGKITGDIKKEEAVCICEDGKFFVTKAFCPVHGERWRQ
jgi:hypothetical protein